VSQLALRPEPRPKARNLPTRYGARDVGAKANRVRLAGPDFRGLEPTCLVVAFTVPGGNPLKAQCPPKRKADPLILNFCSSCEEDFASVAAFDQHRAGKHAYTYSEGVKMEPMREDGRRCLQPSDVGLTPRRPWALA